MSSTVIPFCSNSSSERSGIINITSASGKNKRQQITKKNKCFRISFVHEFPGNLPVLGETCQICVELVNRGACGFSFDYEV